MNVLVFEIRETDKKKKKKLADLVSNRCHDKTTCHQTRSTAQSLALTKQQLLITVIIWLLKLSETKGFFCFSFNKRSPEESWVFCICYFWRVKRKSTETITERCFSCQNKSVCQKLAWSCQKRKSAKIWYTPFLREALQLKVVITCLNEHPAWC